MTEIETPTTAEPEATEQEAGPVDQLLKVHEIIHDEAAGLHVCVRLPNQFQITDIRERAMAAKARRMRQLRMPDTDAWSVLEGDMDRIVRTDAREEVIDDLINRDWFKRRNEAVTEVQQDEEWEHIERDLDRIDQLRGEGVTEGDEITELDDRVGRYQDAVDKAHNELEAPERQVLEAKDISTLVDLLREQRIENDADAHFHLEWSLWEWFTGTYKLDAEGEPAEEHYFASVEAVKQASSRALEVLARGFTELRANFTRGAAGNL